MDLIQLRRIAPFVYGALMAVLWIFVGGGVALAVTIVGALLLGLMYLLTGRAIADSGRGRVRQRNRTRG